MQELQDGFLILTGGMAGRCWVCLNEVQRRQGELSPNWINLGSVTQDSRREVLELKHKDLKTLPLVHALRANIGKYGHIGKYAILICNVV